MITHRDRLEACIHGEVLDRPPVALWRHFPVDDQDPESLTAAHIAFQDLYGFDLIKVTPASSFAIRDWGVEDRWEGSTEGTRTYTRTVIREPRDWGRLPVLEPSAPNLARQLQCLRSIRSRVGSSIPILQTIFSPLAQAKHLAGESRLLDHLRRSPEAVQNGLAIIEETTRRFIEAAMETEIDGVFYAVQHAQSHLLSRAEYIRFGRESDLELLRCAERLWCNILHLHGENIHFDLVCDYPAQIINWHDRDAGPALGKGASLWPGVLCGGLSRQTLVYGTAKDVRKEAAQALETTKRRRLLFSTGCVVPIIAPHGNIVAARQAIEAAIIPSKGRSG